jgi:hypothetical protein
LSHGIAGCIGHAAGFITPLQTLVGMHWPVQVWPLHEPSAAQAHVGSSAAHVAHGAGAGVGVPPSVVAQLQVGSFAGQLHPGGPAFAQPQPMHSSWHVCPVGHSLSALQPVWT